MRYATKGRKAFMSDIPEIRKCPIIGPWHQSKTPLCRLLPFPTVHVHESDLNNSFFHGGSIREMRLGRDCNQDGPFPSITAISFFLLAKLDRSMDNIPQAIQKGPSERSLLSSPSSMNLPPNSGLKDALKFLIKL
jgi:hypothetical protein